MLPVLGFASAAISLFGGMSARKDARAAAAQQRELGKQSGKYIRAEGAENLYRKQYAFGQTESMTKALSAASGVGGLSNDRYVASMKREHTRELDWMKKSTDSRAKIAVMGGGLAADQTQAAGNAAMWGGISGAVGSIGGIRW